MKELLMTLRELAVSRIMKATAVVAAMLGALSIPSFAGADPISDAFASGQSQMSTYITLGVGVIVVLLLLGLGVVILVKYLRKAGRAA